MLGEEEEEEDEEEKKKREEEERRKALEAEKALIRQKARGIALSMGANRTTSRLAFTLIPCY